MLDFLKTLNYVSVEELTNDKIIVSEDEKDIMRERLKNAKSDHFQDWDQLKSRFK